MNPKVLGTIEINWTPGGILAHSFQSFAPLTEYQISDGLAESVVLLVPMQLGLIPVAYTRIFCAWVLDYLAGTPRVAGKIEPPLNSARIELVEIQQTLIATFYPDVVAYGSMPVESAVLNLLENYILHVEKSLLERMIHRYKSALLFGVHLYLCEALAPVARHRGFDPTIPHPAVTQQMREFASNFYVVWQSQRDMDDATYSRLLAESISSLTNLNEHVRG